MRVPQDVIIQIDDSGHWILYNVYTKTSLAICDNTLLLLRQIQQGKDLDELCLDFFEKQFSIQKIGIFSNSFGLLADPSRRIKQYEQWPPVIVCTLTEVVNILEQNKLIIINEERNDLNDNLYKLDKRAYEFAKKFPLWQFFELESA